MKLRDNNNIVVEDREFLLKSTDALAIIKHESGCKVERFNPYTINLSTPIQSLSDLDRTLTITAFSNVDPVSVMDLLVANFILTPINYVTLAGGLGIDEINVGGWLFSIGEYIAILNNAVFGNSNPAQKAPYITTLRENWTQRGMGLYVYNRSNAFDYISPIDPIEDICIGIPTSPPSLIIK